MIERPWWLQRHAMAVQRVLARQGLIAAQERAELVREGVGKVLFRALERRHARLRGLVRAPAGWLCVAAVGRVVERRHRALLPQRQAALHKGEVLLPDVELVRRLATSVSNKYLR